MAEVDAPPGCRVWVGVREGPARFEQKVLVKTARRDDTEALSALAREARVCARLDHPAIPQVFDLFEANGEVVLVLQWTEGVTLESILDDARRRRARLPLAAVAHLGTQLFSALDAAHTARDPRTREFLPIVHQGVNPTAIRVAIDGRIRLGDFGSSRTLAALDLTPAGLLGAHEGYLAPEQVLGDRPTVRTDVYAACLVLRELLTGVPAFPRSDDYLEWLERIAHPSLPDVTTLRPDLDPSLVWLLRVGLRPERDARSVTAAIAAAVLAPFAIDGAAALSAVVQRSAPEEPYESAPRLVRHSSPPDDERPTVSERRWGKPALEARTPGPVLRAVESHPTLPSIRKKRRAPLALFPVATAIVAAAAFVLARPKPKPAPAIEPPRTVVKAPPPPAPSASIARTPPAATLVGSSIASAVEIERLLRDTHARGRFERCFATGDTPGNGVTLRTRCRGGPSLTLLVVKAPGQSERRVAAYTEATFDLWTGWRGDPHAMLIALDPWKLHPVRVPTLAVDNRDGSFGPSFGGGHDLHVAGNLKTGLSIPRSYLGRGDRDFVGAFGSFEVRRLEVWVAR